MITRWHWWWQRLFKRLWFKASLFSLAGVLTALLAWLLKVYIPEDLPANIGVEAVDKILTIIASSMLAVTTFSLNIMVSAYGSATNNVTPRATPLLIEDPITQNTLGTFIGSFLFSLVSIIALSTEIYGSQGRLLLFVATLIVIVLIVYTLLRWIDHLTVLGRVGETTERIERATTMALQQRLATPCLGGSPLPDTACLPHSLQSVSSEQIGYVQLIDMPALASICKDYDCDLYVHVMPGSFVDLSQPLLSCSQVDDRLTARVRSAFTIGQQRSFDQDPRFGLSVLTEVALRALSPATNDPGTAIDVIGRAVRILSLHGAGSPGGGLSRNEECRRIHIGALHPADLFDDVFRPIGRDGASVCEVGIRLQKALLSMARLGDPLYAQEALRHSREALQRAELALDLKADLECIRQLAAEVEQAAEAVLMAVLGKGDHPA